MDFVSGKYMNLYSKGKHKTRVYQHTFIRIKIWRKKGYFKSDLVVLLESQIFPLKKQKVLIN